MAADRKAQHDLTREELVAMHMTSCEVRRWEGKPGFGPKARCSCANEATRLVHEFELLIYGAMGWAFEVGRVLEGLRYGQAPRCWCDMAIDNPMQRSHTKACEAAQGLMDLCLTCGGQGHGTTGVKGDMFYGEWICPECQGRGRR